MPNKFNRQHPAVGVWSSPWRFIRAHRIPEKIRVMHQDKLIARGRWVGLYLPVTSTTTGVVACTCVKDTTQAAETSCLSCYGTKFAPGFLKFLHHTQFWSSAEHASFALSNTSILTTRKAHAIVLSPGQVSGTVTTQDKAFSNVAGLDYSLQLIAYRRSVGATLTLEFSTNAGGTWTPVALTDQPEGYTGTILGVGLTGTGNVRFRLTMTRAAATDPSPAFEILRVRRVASENENPSVIRQRPDHVPGSILVLRPWVNERESLEAGRGRVLEHLNDKTWTAPLDFFHVGLTHDTPSCRIDPTQGPHPFYRYASGVQGGTNYVLISASFNEQFGIFTHQSFDDRRAQDGEPISSVW